MSTQQESHGSAPNHVSPAIADQNGSQNNGHRSKECDGHDPIGKRPKSMALPDLPRFAAPPKAVRVPIVPDPVWFGAGPPPNEPGGAVVVRNIPTSQKVAFITIDDGSNRDPRTADLFRKARVPITVFLIGSVASCEVGFWRGLQKSGVRYEDHTEVHPNMSMVSASRQRKEICGLVPKYKKYFGYRPTLFRNPYGFFAFNSSTVKIAPTCGFKYLVLWQVNVHSKQVVYLRKGPHTMQPGDIVLLHFQDNFVESFTTALQTIKAAGLTPALLEDYLPPDGSVIQPAKPRKPTVSPLGEPTEQISAD
jgi:peptidoglycan/xylan/chitin deacetylase (PgdA/CDA1 family)